MIVDILRYLAFVFFAFGVILIAISMIIFKKNNLKTVTKELKINRRIVAEKEENSELIKNIYYKAEAVKTNKKDVAGCNKKVFSKEKESLARNDTSLLKDSNADDINNAYKLGDRANRKTEPFHFSGTVKLRNK